jgi:hypothetical protein
MHCFVRVWQHTKVSIKPTTCRRRALTLPQLVPRRTIRRLRTYSIEGTIWAHCCRFRTSKGDTVGCWQGCHKAEEHRGFHVEKHTSKGRDTDKLATTMRQDKRGQVEQRSTRAYSMVDEPTPYLRDCDRSLRPIADRSQYGRGTTNTAWRSSLRHYFKPACQGCQQGKARE